MLKMVNATPPANQLEARYGLWISRLIADVERRDRQLGDELAADSVLCPHAPNHILEAKCKELEASLKSTGCCVVCWTTSWEPVTNEEDCTIAEHPHPEEGCLRCGYCAQEKAYKELEPENKRLRDTIAKAALFSSPKRCPQCLH